jgi:hypothetical protein
LKRIEIIVAPKGNSKVETKGFSGSECVEASKFLKDALGNEESMRTTAEFYQLAQNETEISTRN